MNETTCKSDKKRRYVTVTYHGQKYVQLRYTPHKPSSPDVETNGK